MLRGAPVLIGLALASMAVPGGQDRLPIPGRGVIAGRVIDAGTRAPLARARVWLSQTRSARDRDPLASLTTTTGDDGAFVFRALPAGEFRIRSSAPDYLEGAVGKLRPHGTARAITLAADQTIETLTIEQTRESRILGHATDVRGEPVPDLLVYAWPRGEPLSPEWIGNLQPSRTGRDGAFEVLHVPPGDYDVVAPLAQRTIREPPADYVPCGVPPLPPGEARRAAAAPVAPLRAPGTLYATLGRELVAPPAADGSRLTYATTYFPGEIDPERALPVHVAVGENKAGIDFSLSTSRVASIRGRLIRPGNEIGNGTEITLRRVGAPAPRPEGWADATARREADGTFTFLDVPVGTYQLTVTLATSNGCDATGRLVSDVVTTMAIDVPAGGLEHLEVPIAEGLWLRGRVIFPGDARPRELLDIGAVDARGRRAFGEMHDGTFEIMGLTPGRWFLRAGDAARRTWSVASITLNGRDVTADPILVEDADISGVVLTLTTQPASVSGSVFDDRGRPVDDATVVAFPADRRQWTTASPLMPRFSSARTDGGAYTFPAVIPGDYIVAAVDERRMEDWPSATFLESIQAGAPRVHVKAGEPLTLNLVLR